MTYKFARVILTGLLLGILCLILIGCSTTNVIVGTPATIDISPSGSVSVYVKTPESKTKISVRNKDNPYANDK
jgi:hypothetical protein